MGTATVVSRISTIVFAAATAAATAGVAAADPAAGAVRDDGWVLSTTSTSAATAAPPYVGNGYVGTRIPAAGAGFVDAPVATETHISGVYADVTDLAHQTLQPQGAVNQPGWTTLDFFDGTATYALSTGTVTGYRQQLNLRDGTVTTTLTWTSPSGRSTDLRYEVLLDRAQPRLGAVRLSVRPHWSGTATVTDVLGQGFDYHPSFISAGLDPVSQHVSPATATADLTVRTKGTGVTVAYADRLSTPAGATVTGTAVTHETRLSAQFPVAGGRWYQINKTVGMATSLDGAQPRSEERRVGKECR